MNELGLMKSMAKSFRKIGYVVATEVANLYRSADIALIDNSNSAWVIECKLSNISQAIKQLRTHKLAADKVFIGMPRKETRTSTIDLLKRENVGLIYLLPNGDIDMVLGVERGGCPWGPAREKLFRRIHEDN